MSDLLEGRLDPRFDALMSEIATRESYYLFEQVFDEMDNWAYTQLIRSETNEDRLQAQAYAKVIAGMRKSIRKHRSKLNKERPISVGPG